MTENFTTTSAPRLNTNKETSHMCAHTPRKSSVNFIKQFARAYTAIAGVAFEQMILN